MSGTKVIVKKGDCLWNLAQRYLGDGKKWRAIYEHNNSTEVVNKTQTRILDPDLIFIGQVIYIPRGNPEAGPAPAQRNTQQPIVKQYKVPSPRPQPILPRQLEDGKNTAVGMIGIPLKYDLEQVRLAPPIVPGFDVTVKLTGSLTIQAHKAKIIGEITPNQIKTSAMAETNTALMKLTGGCEVGYDPAKNDIEFEIGITLNANMKHAPVYKVSTAVSALGQPVIKASAKYPPIEGTLPGFGYGTSDFGVVIELTKRPESPRPQPIPVTVPAVETRSNWDYAVGTGLIVGAGLLIVATIAEDVITLGAGIADDAPSFAVASAMFAGGMALFEPVTSRTTVNTPPNNGI